MIAGNSSAGSAEREILPTPAGAALELNATVWRRSAGRARAGGDWCDVVSIAEDTVAFTVGDVSGHGASVARTMSAMRALVLRGIEEIRVPSEVLSLANEGAFNDGNGTIVTAIVAFLNSRQRTLTFANAGHPPPLLVTRDGQAFLEHPPADLPLGIFAKHRGADYVIAVPADSMLVFYTDGITEHNCDPIGGELELIEAARLVFQRPEVDAARAIARRLLGTQPTLDDAAAMCARLSPMSRLRIARGRI